MIKLGPAERSEALFNRHAAMVRARLLRNRNNLHRRALGQVESCNRFRRQHHPILSLDELNAHHHFTILSLKIHQVHWGIDK